MWFIMVKEKLILNLDPGCAVTDVKDLLKLINFSIFFSKIFYMFLFLLKINFYIIIYLLISYFILIESFIFISNFTFIKDLSNILIDLILK